jgi:hypothetical protein
MKGQLEDLGVSTKIAVETLATQHALLGYERGGLRQVDVIGEVIPRVGRGRDLREGAEGEAARARLQNTRGVFGRRLQSEAMVHVVGDRPQLLASLDRVFTSIGKIDQTFPVPGRTQGIDGTQEPVHVGCLDQPVDVHGNIVA